LELETVPCDLCGSDDHQQLALIPGEAGGMFSIVKCRPCGLVFVNPRPTAAALSAFYDQWFDDISPENRSADHQAMRDVYSEAFGKISKYFTDGSLLDVGCGYGCFMEYMAERGFKVYGTDYASALLEYLEKALKFRVFQGDLDHVPWGRESFHVVSLFYVLEHVTSPRAVLENCYKLLKKEGIIYIRIPNFNLGRFVLLLRRGGLKISPKLISIICVPNHLYYFTPETAAAMLESAGFSDVTVGSPMPTRRGNSVLRTGRRTFFWFEKAAQGILGKDFIMNPALTIIGRKPSNP